MSLHTSLAQMHAALKDMRRHWDEVGTIWQDAARQSFEENDWTPLEAQVVAAVKGMERLAQAIATCRQDVGGHER